jgi:hypothetical protein
LTIEHLVAHILFDMEAPLDPPFAFSICDDSVFVKLGLHQGCSLSIRHYLKVPRREPALKMSLVIEAVLTVVAASLNTDAFVGQPILAAAGFQPALFVSRFAGFCRKRRSRQGSSVARVNALRLESRPEALNEQYRR